MAKVTFITSDGEEIKTEASKGSVMELAVANNIKGIDGDCGGVCSCATCHVHVPAEFMDKIGKQEEIEKDMLEFEDNTNEFSRLSCQIQVTEAIDGIEFKVAN